MQRQTRIVLLAVTVTALPLAGTAAAEHGGKPRKKSAPVSHPAKAQACPEFGPGFVKIAGTDTCVKVGGTITVEGGINAR